MCRFSAAGMTAYPRGKAAGVRKAPRQEIAGCGAATVQRVLWGFGAGVSVGEVEPTLTSEVEATDGRVDTN